MINEPQAPVSLNEALEVLMAVHPQIDPENRGCRICDLLNRHLRERLGRKDESSIARGARASARQHINTG